MNTSKKILIVGGVAGGATAAARARRLDESAQITLLERGPYVSFANCGLPYFISGDIAKRSKLLLQTPDGFYSRYRVVVKIHTEALSIDTHSKTLKALGPEGEEVIPYDVLILAQGGNPIVPALPGADLDHTFKLWTVPDMDRIHKYIKEQAPKTAVVAGGGFIGLEMAEALKERGLEVTVVELAPQILTVLDPDIAMQAQKVLESHGVQVRTGVGLKEVKSTKTVLLSDGSELSADLVLFSVGVRPELTLVKQAGLELGTSGGLLVNDYLQTSDPSIWAAGDMVEVTHKVSGRKVRVPLAGPANRQGRIAATNALSGGKIESLVKYRGALGTSVVKIFDHTAASTGLTLKGAKDAGIEAHAVVVHKDHHASYYPGSKELSLKLVYEKVTGRLLGGQAFGAEGVEKRIDVLAVALQARMTLEDLSELDLAYAPPYSSANDPINLAAFVGANDLSGFSPLVTVEEFLEEYQEGKDLLVDLRTLGEYSKGHHPQAVHLSVDELRDRFGELDPNKTLYVYCQAGFRGHIALRILKDLGFQKVWNITGGWTSMVLNSRIHIEK